MRLTIIPDDNAVYIDNDCRVLDLSSCNIPQEVHALQWYDTRGWIEFDQVDPFTPKPPNQDITELPAWANCSVVKWQEWTPPEPPADQPITSGTQEI